MMRRLSFTKSEAEANLVGVERCEAVPPGVQEPDAGLRRPARAGDDDHPLLLHENARQSRRYTRD